MYLGIKFDTNHSNAYYTDGLNIYSINGSIAVHPAIPLLVA